MQLNIETIVAFVAPDNERSIRLLERLGFTLTGEGSLEGIDKPQSLYSKNAGDSEAGRGSTPGARELR